MIISNIRQYVKRAGPHIRPFPYSGSIDALLLCADNLRLLRQFPLRLHGQARRKHNA